LIFNVGGNELIVKLAVVGSRNFTDYEFLKKILNSYSEKITQIISGGAQGADNLAKQYAIKNGIAIKEFIPNWDVYGKSAGYIRNEKFIKAADELIAFGDKISRETKHSIDLAEKYGKPVYTYWPPESDITEGIGI